MTAPGMIAELVERFERNREAYHSPPYKEAQLRREFIDPLFIALGWDVENKQGYAEAYKDVVHEDAVKVGGATKAPDYCFRIGGTRKFFVETKKPSVSIKTDPDPAYQLRRYAWSAKLPLSILTDFEEFVVYDCRIKPSPGDKPSVARTMYVEYGDYPEHWDEIAAIFARDAVLKGSFDKYAEKKRKRGTAEVDAAFLKDIEAWRDELARGIALRNPKLSTRELNFAVQRTIDRIIFLRICEDRGIEEHGRLMALLNGTQVYKRLFRLFQEADERYNSGLFQFQKERDRAEGPDELTPGLEIDDKLLKAIIKGLYYPDSPYEFSVLPADILGQVYEQFLGKVIRLTAGHRAVVEDKPEVKKAGGVYYTPTYIVDYIVENTVGKLLEKSTPDKAAKLRVLDPACGSGSFLIGAYQYLLDWHRKFYEEHDPASWAKKRPARVYEGRACPEPDGRRGGAWRLTTAERKRILLNNIYGVDIDTQAVEVTKLSLLLKVLEGESGETLAFQRRFFHERALPDLAGNIKCGNSLIGPDFYEGKQMPLLDDEERYRINVFDWHKEFPTTMKAGGFDAVIGNPPYVLLQAAFRDDSQVKYFRSKYSVASYKIDTYHLFMERGMRLTADGGRFSMITPANFLTNNYLVDLRRFLLDSSRIDHILLVEGGVFAGVSVDNAIFVLVSGKRTQKAFPLRRSRVMHGQLAEGQSESVSVAAPGDANVLFTGSSGKALTQLWRRVQERSVPLGDIAHVNFGKQLRDRKKFKQDVIQVPSVRGIPAGYKPCYTGRDILRYSLTWGNLACLDDEVARCGGCWDRGKHNATSKLLTRQIGRYPEFCIDAAGYQCLNTLFMVSVRESCHLDPRFVLACLNSTLTRAFWLDLFYDKRRTFPKIKGTYLKKLPVCAIREDSPQDMEKHNATVALVGSMLALHEKLGKAKTAHDKELLQREIDATDRQIDELMYELYGLTDEEIGTIEESGAGS